MLIVMRLCSGGAAASVQAVGAGSIADMWESRERGAAMGIFYLGPLMGPLVAPIIGGGLSQAWSWRATQWFQAIYGGVTLVLILLFLPETLVSNTTGNIAPSLPATGNEKQPGLGPGLSTVSTRQSIHLKTKKSAKIFKRCIIDPLAVLLYLRFPAVLLVVIQASVAFGALYILNISIQRTFSASPYNFGVSVSGFLLISLSLISIRL
jgi:MFS family permease